jgi:hypothetical protein
MKRQDRTYRTQEVKRSGDRSTSVADRDSVVVVEVPDEHAGLSLINHLSRLHAELSPVDDTRCAVRVELRERTLEALIDIFRRVRSWMSYVGVRTLRAHFGKRVYTITAW